MYSRRNQKCFDRSFHKANSRLRREGPKFQRRLSKLQEKLLSLRPPPPSPPSPVSSDSLLDSETSYSPEPELREDYESSPGTDWSSHGSDPISDRSDPISDEDYDPPKWVVRREFDFIGEDARDLLADVMFQTNRLAQIAQLKLEFTQLENEVYKEAGAIMLGVRRVVIPIVRGLSVCYDLEDLGKRQLTLLRYLKKRGIWKGVVEFPIGCVQDKGVRNRLIKFAEDYDLSFKCN